VANIKAGVTLTMDNAATLRRNLGREPSNSELALAHQQGADTAAKMLTGTGNAPRRNLIVNKVDPNLPPQEAAKQIMNYYGFGRPGVTLNNSGMFDPNAPGAFAAPTAGAVPYAGGFTPPTTPGVSLDTTPVAPAAPAANFAERFMGTDLQGGKDTPYGKMVASGGLDDVAKGISPKADPKLNDILPTSGASVDQRIAASQPLAQNMLTQMIQQIQMRRGMR
jgi:flagellar protein FlgJ